MLVPYRRCVRPRICNIPDYKGYNYILLVYMEDLERVGCTYGDLLAFLDSLHVRCACSPVHDMDTFTSDDVWSWCERHIDPDTGDLDTHYLDSAPYVGKQKKPHVHLLFMNRSKKSVQDMGNLFSLLDVRPTMWDRCEDPFSMVRYFAHMDSPDKYPYSPYDIHGFGGINLDMLVCNDSKSRMHEITGLIIDLIQQEDVCYFFHLVSLVRKKYTDPEFESCVFGRHALFNAVIKSKREAHYDLIAEKERKRKREIASKYAGEMLG